MVKDLLNKPYGLVLVTGPTGSGKTTTLYSALELIKSVHHNIVTVEDPVEYQIELVNQVQVDAGRNVSFATALRSILRQDPDVIMVGEIRDAETAKVAVQAALTGHLVLSTLAHQRQRERHHAYDRHGHRELQARRRVGGRDRPAARADDLPALPHDVLSQRRVSRSPALSRATSVAVFRAAKAAASASTRAFRVESASTKCCPRTPNCVGWSAKGPTLETVRDWFRKGNCPTCCSAVCNWRRRKRPASKKSPAWRLLNSR